MKKKKSSKSAKILSEGNTRTKSQIAPAKYWCFTFNNYTTEDMVVLKKQILENKNISEYIIGKETGKEGTKHLQGFVSFKSKIRPKTLFSEKIHWESAKGSKKQQEDYCSKDKDLFMCNMELKEDIRILDFKDLYQWQIKILNILESEPDKRDIHWYYGAQGVGKSSFQKYCVVQHNALILNGSASDMKHGIVRHLENHKNTPKIIMSNIPFDKDMSLISYSGYEEIKDMLFYSGKYEGGMVCGNPPHLIIFSNKRPETENKKIIIKKINQLQTDIYPENKEEESESESDDFIDDKLTLVF